MNIEIDFTEEEMNMLDEGGSISLLHPIGLLISVSKPGYLPPFKYKNKENKDG